MNERKNPASFFQVVTQFNRDASNNVGWRFGGGAVDSVDPRFSLTESQLEFGFGFNYALSSSAMRRSLHEGTYECENEVGKATVQVLSVSDCQWSGWGGWGRCGGGSCGTGELKHSHLPRNGEPTNYIPVFVCSQASSTATASRPLPATAAGPATRRTGRTRRHATWGGVPRRVSI